MRSWIATAAFLAPQLAWADCVYTGAKRPYIECIYAEAAAATSGLMSLALEVVGLGGRVDDAEADLTALGSDQVTLSARLDGVESAVSSFVVDIDGLETWAATTTTTVGSLGERADAHDLAVSVLEQRADAHDTELVVLDGRVTSAESSLSTLWTDVTGLAASLTSVISDLATLNGSLTTLGGDLDDVASDVGALDNRVADLEDADEQLRYVLAGACVGGNGAAHGSFLTTTTTAGQTCAQRCVEAHASASCAWGVTFWAGGVYYGYTSECAGVGVNYQQGSSGYHCCCRQSSSAVPPLGM